MDDAPVVRRASESRREDILTAASGWCAPSATGFELAESWTAPSGNRYPAWVVEEDSPWPIRAPRRDDYRFVTPAQLARWREEDRWLAAQLRLCRRQHVEDEPESRIKTEYLRG